jgi:hypothetical protein
MSTGLLPPIGADVLATSAATLDAPELLETPAISCQIAPEPPRAAAASWPAPASWEMPRSMAAPP